MIDLTGCESEWNGLGSELPQPAIALERLESSKLIKKFLFQTQISVLIKGVSLF